MSGLTPDEVLRRRLATQRLSTPGLPTAAEVVGLLTAVQAQERGHAFWSLGMRTAGLDEAAVRAEVDAGRILRTHLLRPTWHLVRPEDIGWLLEATSARVQQRNAGSYRGLGLEVATLERAAEVIVAAVTPEPLSREEVGARLAAEGLPATGGRLAHLVMWAELEGLICSGPLRGATHTYVPLTARVDPARALRPEDPTAELVLRFFRGHGPATVADLARWSSLTRTAVAAALAGVADQLEHAEVAGHTVWWDPDAPPPAPEPDPVDAGPVWLVPLYDELTLSYPEITFPARAGHPHVPGDDLFVGSVLDTRHNLGLWRRTVTGRSVRLELDLAPGCSAAQRAAARSAAERLARFLGRVPVW